MLRLTFLVASLLAVLGGLAVGTRTQQGVAALVAATLLAHHLLHARVPAGLGAAGPSHR